MSIDGPGRPPDLPPPPPPPDPPGDGSGDHMDPVLAANVAAIREEAELQRARGDEHGALQSEAAAARYEAMISPGYLAGGGTSTDGAAADARAGAEAMQRWEAAMDPILAENAAAMREDSARMRAQGDEEGAARSDAAAARAEALIGPDQQASRDGTQDAPPAPAPSDDGGAAMQRWEASMDPILADNVAAIRREAEVLRSQGNEAGARECEAAAARYEAMISPEYLRGRGR